MNFDSWHAFDTIFGMNRYQVYHLEAIFYFFDLTSTIKIYTYISYVSVIVF